MRIVTREMLQAGYEDLAEGRRPWRVLKELGDGTFLVEDPAQEYARRAEEDRILAEYDRP